MSLNVTIRKQPLRYCRNIYFGITALTSTLKNLQLGRERIVDRFMLFISIFVHHGLYQSLQSTRLGSYALICLLVFKPYSRPLELMGGGPVCSKH